MLSLSKTQENGGSKLGEKVQEVSRNAIFLKNLRKR